MSPHSLVKCKSFQSDLRIVASFQTLEALKRASCGLSLVALKTTGCDVWQLECQASNVTASVQSDHSLHGYMLPVVFHIDHSRGTPRCAKIQPNIAISCCHKPKHVYINTRASPVVHPRRSTRAMQVIESTKQHYVNS